MRTRHLLSAPPTVVRERVKTFTDGCAPPGGAARRQAVSADSGTLSEGRALVLVVDDEEMVRGVTARALQVLGYGVLTAVSGEDALRIVGERRGEIACVLLDMTMPGMSGEAV